MKVATWNVNSLRVRFEQVATWLAGTNPDVVALQETKTRDEDFPVAELERLGFKAAFNGQGAYNGVALLARETPTDVVTELDGFEDPQRRVLGATLGALRVYNLYVPNGQSLDSPKYAYKLDWLAALQLQLARELGRHERLVVLGDFNIAPENRDVHDPALWEGRVHCSPAERASLRKVLALGLYDAFRLFEQPAGTFSWWDYRAGAFRRNLGLRIDLILCTNPLKTACTKCSIDRAPRGWARPSDHAPVVAEFREGLDSIAASGTENVAAPEADRT